MPNLYLVNFLWRREWSQPAHTQIHAPFSPSASEQGGRPKRRTLTSLLPTRVGGKPEQKGRHPWNGILLLEPPCNNTLIVQNLCQPRLLIGDTIDSRRNGRRLTQLMGGWLPIEKKGWSLPAAQWESHPSHTSKVQWNGGRVTGWCMYERGRDCEEPACNRSLHSSARFADSG